jgi:hypothetical protein
VKTNVRRHILLGALVLAACGPVETGSSPGNPSTPKKGVSKGPTTGGSGSVNPGGDSGVDPDLSDPSIVGSTRPPLGGSQLVLKCVTNADTACTTDTWGNYAGAAFRGTCGGCHNLYNTTNCDVALNGRDIIVGRVSTDNMPPGGLGGNKDRFLTWFNCGCPL